VEVGVHERVEVVHLRLLGDIWPVGNRVVIAHDLDPGHMKWRGVEVSGGRFGDVCRRAD